MFNEEEVQQVSCDICEAVFNPEEEGSEGIDTVCSSCLLESENVTYANIWSN